jgi:hypothetical protein
MKSLKDLYQFLKDQNLNWIATDGFQIVQSPKNGGWIVLVRSEDGDNKMSRLYLVKEEVEVLSLRLFYEEVGHDIEIKEIDGYQVKILRSKKGTYRNFKFDVYAQSYDKSESEKKILEDNIRWTNEKWERNRFYFL